MIGFLLAAAAVYSNVFIVPSIAVVHRVGWCSSDAAIQPSAGSQLTHCPLQPAVEDFRENRSTTVDRQSEVEHGPQGLTIYQGRIASLTTTQLIVHETLF